MNIKNVMGVISLKEKRIKTSIFPHNKACGDLDLINSQLILHLLKQLEIIYYEPHSKYIDKVKEIKIEIVEDEKNAKKPFLKGV